MQKVKELREENRLAKLSIKGDRKALEKLVSKYINFSYSISSTILDEDRTAKKAVEDAFRQAINSIQDLYNPKGFLVWFYDILKKSIDANKLKGKTSDIQYDKDLNSDLVSYNTIGGIQESDKEMLVTFLKIIRAQDDIDKEIFALMDFEGFSAIEVGVILGLETREVRTRLYNIKSQLKEIFLKSRTGGFSIPVKNPDDYLDQTIFDTPNTEEEA